MTCGAGQRGPIDPLICMVAGFCMVVGFRMVTGFLKVTGFRMVTGGFELEAAYFERRLSNPIRFDYDTIQPSNTTFFGMISRVRIGHGFDE